MNKCHFYHQIDEMTATTSDDKAMKSLCEDKNKLTKMINELMSRNIGLTFEEKIDFLVKNNFSFSIYMTNDEYDDEGNFKGSTIVKCFSGSTISSSAPNISTI